MMDEHGFIVDKLTLCKIVKFKRKKSKSFNPVIH